MACLNANPVVPLVPQTLANFRRPSGTATRREWRIPANRAGSPGIGQNDIAIAEGEVVVTSIRRYHDVLSGLAGRRAQISAAPTALGRFARPSHQSLRAGRAPDVRQSEFHAFLADFSQVLANRASGLYPHSASSPWCGTPWGSRSAVDRKSTDFYTARPRENFRRNFFPTEVVRCT
jgi:hypothetical protein